MLPDVVISRLEQLFPEISREHGLYELLGDSTEGRRAIASMISLVWLIQDRYESFISPQNKEDCLTLELWQQLRHFVDDFDIRPDMIHVVFVFLAIRGLGKV